MSMIAKLACALFLLAGVGLAACNTIKGAGQDVSAAGRGIENAAEDAQDELDKENP